jgi:hypothetical protein
MRDNYAQNDSGGYQSSHLLQNQPPATGKQPPAYGAWSEDDTDEYSRWDPRGWSLKTKIFIAIGAVVVIVAVVVGAVLGVRANRYPDYSKLNYSLKDTYSGSSFFDNFEYFTGADPTHGFVQYDSYISSRKKGQLTCDSDTSTGLHPNGSI